MLRARALPLLGLSLALLPACTLEPQPVPNTTGGGLQPVCTAPAEIACEDQVVQGINLQNDVAPGALTTEPDPAGGFISSIDATAGGAFTSDPDSYVYGRFTEAGLEKVEISDEQSLTQMDWDIAFRRYVVRINSGNSGPSCVAAARVPGVTYDSLTAAPDNLTFRTDEYFSASCEVIPDGSGLPGAPATALSGFWSYEESCVAMSDFVYVVRLADGQQVKLNVDSYYLPDVQEQCDSTGMVPMMGAGAANYRVRWAFLP